MNRGEVITGYADWLTSYEWDWFVVLLCRGFPATAVAKRKCARWLRDLELQNGTADFRYACVTELGRSGANPHFHLLVGGLLSKRRARFIQQWNDIGGVATIRDFNPEDNGVLYMLKTFSLAEGIDIDFRLPESRQALGRIRK